MRKELTIAVIGLGLIGGSILKALRPSKFRLIGVSKSEETIKKAIQFNLVDECSTDINIIKDANIVFICTPISKITFMIDTIHKIVQSDCIITDVASLKEFVIDHVNNYNSPINFIGGHPMAGTEYQGIDHAVDNLFEGAKWVLTPSKWTNTQDFNKLKDILLNYTGAQIITADACEHDKAVALISHMPLLLSETLFGFVSNYKNENIKELSLKLAASGFRDTTRLAGTNPELAKDMLIQNKTNIKESINDLKNYLDILSNKLDTDESEFIKQIQEIALIRREMYSSYGKNIY